MKRTVGRWTAIQNRLPATPPGERLWDWIERRTYGKLGQSKVSIDLTHEKEWAGLVEDAEAQLGENEEHSA